MATSGYGRRLAVGTNSPRGPRGRAGAWNPGPCSCLRESSPAAGSTETRPQQLLPGAPASPPPHSAPHSAPGNRCAHGPAGSPSCGSPGCNVGARLGFQGLRAHPTRPTRRGPPTHAPVQGSPAHPQRGHHPGRGASRSPEMGGHSSQAQGARVHLPIPMLPANSPPRGIPGVGGLLPSSHPVGTLRLAQPGRECSPTPPGTGLAGRPGLCGWEGAGLRVLGRRGAEVGPPRPPPQVLQRGAGWGGGRGVGWGGVCARPEALPGTCRALGRQEERAHGGQCRWGTGGAGLWGGDAPTLPAPVLRTPTSGL